MQAHSYSSLVLRFCPKNQKGPENEATLTVGCWQQLYHSTTSLSNLFQQSLNSLSCSSFSRSSRRTLLKLLQSEYKIKQQVRSSKSFIAIDHPNFCYWIYASVTGKENKFHMQAHSYSSLVQRLCPKNQMGPENEATLTVGCWQQLYHSTICFLLIYFSKVLTLQVEVVGEIPYNSYSQKTR